MISSCALKFSSITFSPLAIYQHRLPRTRRNKNLGFIANMTWYGTAAEGWSRVATLFRMCTATYIAFAQNGLGRLFWYSISQTSFINVWVSLLATPFWWRFLGFVRCCTNLQLYRHCCIIFDIYSPPFSDCHTLECLKCCFSAIDSQCRKVANTSLFAFDSVFPTESWMIIYKLIQVSRPTKWFHLEWNTNARALKIQYHLKSICTFLRNWCASIFPYSQARRFESFCFMFTLIPLAAPFWTKAPIPSTCTWAKRRCHTFISVTNAASAESEQWADVVFTQ